MKNLTIALPDDVYRKARIHAAERGTSISGLVRDYLTSLAGDDSDAARRVEERRLLLERLQSTGSFSASDRLSRDDLHDRQRARDEMRDRAVR